VCVCVCLCVCVFTRKNVLAECLFVVLLRSVQKGEDAFSKHLIYLETCVDIEHTLYVVENYRLFEDCVELYGIK